MVLTETDKEYLLKLARESVESITKEGMMLNIPDNCPEHLKENLGVFCTINKNNELRGCIGYPEPVKPLIDALIDVSVSAARNDPRFEVLREDELDDISIELSVLTKPEIIEVESPSEYPEKIEIGKDGLIVRKGFYNGLLLPQVATEYNMDEVTFLEHTCLKAGLSSDEWLNDDTKVFKFQGEIFSE